MKFPDRFKRGQVHRFSNFVALYVRPEGSGKGTTVYLSRREAEAMAKALRAGARDLRANAPHESACGTFSLDQIDGDDGTTERRATFRAP